MNCPSDLTTYQRRIWLVLIREFHEPTNTQEVRDLTWCVEQLARMGVQPLQILMAARKWAKHNPNGQRTALKLVDQWKELAQ